MSMLNLHVAPASNYHKLVGQVSGPQDRPQQKEACAQEQTC